MADQGIWFKLHCSALDDPDLDNLEIGNFGRWAKLGAFIKRHGTAGTIHLAPPARALCAALQVPDFEALMKVIERFPHVTVRRDDSSVSLVTSVSVTFDNWLKYQGDFSSPRVSKFRQMKRSKRRGEEKKTRREKEPLPVTPPAEGLATVLEKAKITAGLWTEIVGALDRSRFLGAVPRLRDPLWWGAQLAAYGERIDAARIVAEAEAYLVRTPAKRAQYRDLARFLGNWMAREAKESPSDG
jgi:hypothetical protein